MEEYIRSAKLLRVITQDGRAFFGQLICSDRDCNFILQSATEIHLSRPDSKRYIGTIVIPGEEIKTAGFSGYAVQYSPFYDNKIAVATAANFGLVGNGRLYILEIGADGVIRPETQYDTQDGLFNVCWSEAHENHVATANGDGSIKLFDIKAAQFPIIEFREHQKEVFGLSWNNVDKQQFCSCSWDGTIKVWSPSAGPRSIHTIATVPLAAPKSTIPAIKNATRNAQQQGTSTSAPANCVYAAKYSPHEPSLIASAHSDSTVRMHDLRSAQPASVIQHAHSGVECLALDWNKYRRTVIATAGVDNTIKVWDIRNLGSPLNEMRGHDYAVRNVAWSPHSADLLISASYDTTVRVWRDDSATGAPHIPRLSQSKGLLSIFDKHSEFAIGTDWSLWGEPGWVTSVGWDEAVYVWKAV